MNPSVRAFEACPATEEIVTTDSGYYGPKPDDARLIAAAPDLLAVAKKFRDALACVCALLPDPPCPRCVADAAIAKAEGK